MKQLSALVILGLAAASVGGPACGQVSETSTPAAKKSLLRNCSLEGFVQKVSGYTEYHIQFPIKIYVTDGHGYYLMDGEGHSVLAFPIDGYAAGLRASIFNGPKRARRASWGLELSASALMTQPSEAMVDSDWVAVPTVNIDQFVFGATKSEVHRNSIEAGLRAKYRVAVGRYSGAEFECGYRFLHNGYEVIGLSGWYTDGMDLYPVEPADYAGVTVGKYSVNFHLPEAGARLVFENEEGMQISLNGDLGYAFASDLDDHVLRHKKAETSARGFGFCLTGETRVTLARFARGRSLYAGASYAITRLKATGKQTQTFYGDDPGTTDNETGLVLPDIDNTIRFRQTSITALVGYKL